MLNEYILALAGGAFIGLSAGMLWFYLSKIAGLSGVFESLLSLKPLEPWKIKFLAGFLIAAITSSFLLPQFFEYSFNVPTWIYIVAGLLVGFGTRLANGCTSGHGVCGLARLSKRSFVAVCTFMFFAILTVLLRGQLQ